MIRRKAEVLAVEKGQRVLVQFARADVLTDGHQKASPFAVDAEILRTAGRDKTFGHRGCNKTGSGGIFLKPVAESLIRNIDHRHCAGFEQDLHNRFPFGQIEVGTGWIVTTPVQQHDIAPACCLEVFDHRIERHGTGFAVEVSIRDNLDSEVVQYGNMVWPGWVGHEHPGIGSGHPDQLKGLSARPGSAGCRGEGDLVARDGIAQHQIRQRGPKGRIADQTGIHLGILFFPQLVFRFLDRTHHGRQPGCVLVDANAQVNLGGPWIILVQLHQGQDLVGGLRLQGFEHQASPVATATVGNIPHSAQEPS